MNTFSKPPFTAPANPWRLSVAPMMDWTDRHCRFFHRLITQRARLYTEMVTTGALRHGDVPRHLDYSAFEHPVALQVGGSEPPELAHAARLAAQWGYAEINLNCGCPSERVQRGAFGACLMAEAPLVADGVKAMRDAVDLPVTVKHRIGIDRNESYAFVRDFVGTVAQQSGCEVFIVHARNAWLQGLSPKENREIPPLRYGMVRRLKKDFPALTVVLNGGVRSDADIALHLAAAAPPPGGAEAELDSALNAVDGVMLGREAYHNPWCMADWDTRFLGAEAPEQALTRESVELAMVSYMEDQALCHGTPWPHIARHMLGLWHGRPGARLWRQTWSDHRLKSAPPRAVYEKARLLRSSAEAAHATEPSIQS